MTHQARKTHPRSALLIVGLLFLCGACASPPPTAQAPAPAPRATPQPSPAPTASAIAVAVPHDDTAIHNLWRAESADGRIISGGVPIGDAGFDELCRLGVKTVISVDGGTPDLDRAAARGMRYIHIPVTYADVNERQRLELARAIRDAESSGPVYIHCHHGKHRSPAATAAALVALNRFTPAQGVAFMKAAGTADHYQGLYRCVSTGAPADPAAILAINPDLPAVRKPEGMVAAMVEVDLAFEHLGEIRAAGWKTPKDHPDLVPAAEAGRLADQLRFSGEDPRSVALGADYMAALTYAINLATTLEENILRGASTDELNAGYRLIQASCKDCHAAYRDKAD